MLKKIIKHPLTYILLFALILRVVMINYGLPFWLYNDEPPFVLGALKMMQLKTVLPVLHQEAFNPFLYYPPYICYLFLPFFVITASISFLFFDGNFSEFQNVLAGDPSIFFITGRFVTILISLATIYFTYKIIDNFINDKKVALFISFLGATSVISIMLSITGKHWMPILFFYTISLFLLTKKEWSLKKRLFTSGIATGIGTGVSSIVILFSIVIFLWYLIFEKKKISQAIKDIDLYKTAGIIAVLSFIPVLLYPASLGFVPDTTLNDTKTIIGYLSSPINFPFKLFVTEPIIFILFLSGIVFGAKKYSRFWILIISFIIIYSVIFYTFFRFEYRFILPIYLFLCIGASFGIIEIKRILSKTNFTLLIISLILISLIISIRLSFLGFQNDSRVKAKIWLENNSEQNEKVIVYANLMRLPNNVNGIKEQSFLDPNSLRTNDKSELIIPTELRKEKIFHALNLYNVQNDNFYNDISKYAKTNQYKYLIISKEDFLNKPEQFAKVRTLTEKAELVAKFGNNYRDYSLTKSDISPSLLPLFIIKEFGPEIEIYKL